MDKSREQFESYFSDKHDLTMKHFGDPVIKFTMDRLFEVWQASRESLEVELLQPIPVDDEEASYEEGLSEGYNNAIADFKQILISNGVKVK